MPVVIFANAEVPTSVLYIEFLIPIFIPLILILFKKEPPFIRILPFNEISFDTNRLPFMEASFETHKRPFNDKSLLTTN